MFEKEIKFISDFSLNKIKNLGSFITLEKLSKSNIHPAIFQYISGELNYLINEDRKKLLKDSIFDYSGNEITKHFNLIASELKKTKRITYEDIKTLVLQAVSFNISFTVKPRWSLQKFIYGNTDNRPVDDILLMFEYLYYYDYIKKIFTSYLSKKKVVNLSLMEFEIIMNKIDKELFSSQANTLLDNALVSIADFFNEGGVNKTKISIAAVEMFLKDKNLIDYLFRLRRAVPLEAKQNFSIEEIKDILYSTVPVERQTASSKEEEDLKEKIEQENMSLKETPKEEMRVLDIEKEENIEDFQIMEEQIEEDEFEPLENVDQSNINEADKDDNDVMLSSPEDRDELFAMYDAELKQFEDEEKITNDSAEIEFDLSEKNNLDKMYEFEEEKTEEQKEEQKEDLGFTFEFEKKNELKNDIFEDKEIELEPVMGREEKKAEPLKSKRQKDLFSFLSNREIEKVVDYIFNEDKDDFANTMEKISECEDYDEATDILKSVFSSYKVNPYSRDAVILTNAVSNYFSQ